MSVGRYCVTHDDARCATQPAAAIINQRILDEKDELIGLYKARGEAVRELEHASQRSMHQHSEGLHGEHGVLRARIERLELEILYQHGELEALVALKSQLMLERTQAKPPEPRDDAAWEEFERLSRIIDALSDDAGDDE